MSIFDYITKPISEFIAEKGTINYVRPPKYSEVDVPSYVPSEFKSKMVELSNKFDFDPRKVAGILNTENTPWDPELKNPLPGSTAQGLGQHTDAYQKQYNPKFKKEYNRDYIKTNPYDSIAATYIGLSELMQATKNEDDAIRAYHAGLSGYKGKYKNKADEYLKKVLLYASQE